VGLFCSIGLAIIKTRPTEKNEQNASYRKMKKVKEVEKLQIFKLSAVHFILHNSPEAALDLAGKGLKFP
jgi:hypothetical protein